MSTKVDFLEGRLLSSQSASKSSDWLKEADPPKRHFVFRPVIRLYLDKNSIPSTTKLFYYSILNWPQDREADLRLKQMLYYALCLQYPAQKLFCLHVFRQDRSKHRVDCLAPRWETAPWGSCLLLFHYWKKSASTKWTFTCYINFTVMLKWF